jgi:sporulation protein YlmC with PRC-barrel domain
MADAKPILLRLRDTQLTVADPHQDVRGYKVIDKDEREFGSVEDLLIDDTEKRVRFLLVGSGGFLGLGERKFLIPVDAIKRITADRVCIDRAGDHVAQGPHYDPALADETQLQEHLSTVYGYYGYMPYWGAGYAFPGFPHVIR